MSKHEKLIARLLERPRNFTWDEAITLLSRCGYRLYKRGSGSSHKAFHCVDTGDVIHISQPHPGNELKRYQMDELIKKLKQTGRIK